MVCFTLLSVVAFMVVFLLSVDGARVVDRVDSLMACAASEDRFRSHGVTHLGCNILRIGRIVNDSPRLLISKEPECVQYIGVPIPTNRPPVDRSLLRDDVYLRLRDAIIDGTFAPGEQLRDGDLATWLGV